MENDKYNTFKPNYHICSYKSKKDVEYVKNLITEGSKIPISKYINKHVLYVCIIHIKTIHNFIIIKFGYSGDIIDRLKSLETEYKTKINFIKAKIITCLKDESYFHEMLKTHYSDLIEEYRIKSKSSQQSYCGQGKKKKELYKLSPILITEFDNYLNNENTINIKYQNHTDIFEENWKNVCFENDSVASFFENNYKKTGKETDAVNKDELLKDFRQITGKHKYSWNTLLNDIKCLGFLYDRQKQVRGIRGVITGLVRKVNTSQYNNIHADKDIDFLDDEDN